MPQDIDHLKRLPLIRICSPDFDLWAGLATLILPFWEDLSWEETRSRPPHARLLGDFFHILQRQNVVFFALFKSEGK